MLETRVKLTETARETTRRIEYWFMGALVRSDVNINLKQGLGLPFIEGRIGG